MTRAKLQLALVGLIITFAAGLSGCGILDGNKDDNSTSEESNVFGSSSPIVGDTPQVTLATSSILPTQRGFSALLGEVSLTTDWVVFVVSSLEDTTNYTIDQIVNGDARLVAWNRIFRPRKGDEIPIEDERIVPGKEYRFYMVPTSGEKNGRLQIHEFRAAPSGKWVNVKFPTVYPQGTMLWEHDHTPATPLGRWQHGPLVEGEVTETINTATQYFPVGSRGVARFTEEVMWKFLANEEFPTPTNLTRTITEDEQNISFEYPTVRITIQGEILSRPQTIGDIQVGAQVTITMTYPN